MIDAVETAGKLAELAEALGIPKEERTAFYARVLSSTSGSQSDPAPEVLQPVERARIVYPNVQFPPYVYREYPKIYYRGVVRDVKQDIIIVRDGRQLNATQTLRDQYVGEHLIVHNKAEELTATTGWFKTLIEAKDHALAVRAGRGNKEEPWGEGVEVEEIDNDPPEQEEEPVRRRKGGRRAA